MDRIVPPISPGNDDPTPPGWTRAAVAMGSNLGDRRGHLVFAVARLADHFQRLQGFTHHRDQAGRRHRRSAGFPERRRRGRDAAGPPALFDS